ncbi:hypothetical protein GH816_07845 [Betaproteobacteria bacterium LSUCC0115]|nr:hypothetical protein [Burkholderiales bacterium LSUCC0115]
MASELLSRASASGIKVIGLVCRSSTRSATHWVEKAYSTTIAPSTGHLAGYHAGQARGDANEIPEANCSSTQMNPKSLILLASSLG